MTFFLTRSRDSGRKKLKLAQKCITLRAVHDERKIQGVRKTVPQRISARPRLTCSPAHTRQELERGLSLRKSVDDGTGNLHSCRAFFGNWWKHRAVTASVPRPSPPKNYFGKHREHERLSLSGPSTRARITAAVRLHRPRTATSNRITQIHCKEHPLDRCKSRGRHSLSPKLIIAACI